MTRPEKPSQARFGTSTSVPPDGMEGGTPAMQWPPSKPIVEQAQNREHEAFETLYRVARPRLRAFLGYQGFHGAEGDELAAEIMQTVLLKIDTLRNPQAFEAWFWAIARNRIRGHLRQKQRDKNLVGLATPSPIQPDEAVVLNEEYRDIRAALARLSPNDRELLWLREVEGLSYRDIGGRLGASTGAVRVRCHRARQRLEAAFRAGTGTGATGVNPPAAAGVD